MEDPLVLHPWSVVTINILGKPWPAPRGCLECEGIVGFKLRDLGGMGFFRGNTCIYLWRGLESRNFEVGVDGLVGYIKGCIGYFPEDI
jgi:hypothetical protein